MIGFETSTLSEQLDALSRATNHEALGHADALFDRLKKSEKANIEEGLRDPRFPFDEAQHALAAHYRRFGCIAEELGARQDLEPGERRRLGDLALIGSRARLTTARDLQAIRLAQGRRARMSA
jgi:hypothetical protein